MPKSPSVCSTLVPHHVVAFLSDIFNQDGVSDIFPDPIMTDYLLGRHLECAHPFLLTGSQSGPQIPVCRLIYLTQILISVVGRWLIVSYWQFPCPCLFSLPHPSPFPTGNRENMLIHGILTEDGTYLHPAHTSHIVSIDRRDKRTLVLIDTTSFRSLLGLGAGFAEFRRFFFHFQKEGNG